MLLVVLGSSGIMGLVPLLSIGTESRRLVKVRPDVIAAALLPKSKVTAHNIDHNS